MAGIGQELERPDAVGLGGLQDRAGGYPDPLLKYRGKLQLVKAASGSRLSRVGQSGKAL